MIRGCLMLFLWNEWGSSWVVLHAAAAMSSTHRQHVPTMLGRPAGTFVLPL